MSENNGGFGTFLGGFLMGGFVGAIVALLYAPRSGEVTREQLRSSGIILRDSAEQTADEFLEALRATTKDLKTRTEELRLQSQAALDEAQKQWTQASKEIKQVATEAVEEIKVVAAEAGKGTKEAVTEVESKPKKAATKSK